MLRVSQAVQRPATVTPTQAVQRPGTATPTQRLVAELPETPVTPTTFHHLTLAAALLDGGADMRAAALAAAAAGGRPGLAANAAAAAAAIMAAGAMALPEDAATRAFLSPPAESDDSVGARQSPPRNFTVSPPPLVRAPVASERDRVPQINIGPAFQARVPPCVVAPDSAAADAAAADARAELVWAPDAAVLDVPGLDDYLAFAEASELFAGLSRDERLDLAYRTLYAESTARANTPVDPAAPAPPPSLLTGALLALTNPRAPVASWPHDPNVWTPDEETTFWQALVRHGKQFALIQRHMGNKPLAAIVRYYYLNKHRAEFQHYLNSHRARREQERRRQEQEGVLVRAEEKKIIVKKK